MWQLVQSISPSRIEKPGSAGVVSGTRSAPGSGNVDRIMDFNVRDDTFWLDDSVFPGLALGALPSGAFAKGTSATQADDRIIYDSKTGNLYFDPDGLGGTQQMLIASLDTGLKLTAADFTVI